MWWVIAWPLLVAVWAFLFGFFACCYFDRGGAEPVAGTGRGRWSAGPAKRSLRWVSYLSVGVGGLILVMSLPMWLDWGHLSFHGVPVRAQIVNTKEELTADPDPDIPDRYVTHVTYRFEAEVGGQRQQFQREGKLRGRYQVVSGFIHVLYDPANPKHSRMTREFRAVRDGMVAAAVILALDVASVLLSRKQGGRIPRGLAHAGDGVAVPR